MCCIEYRNFALLLDVPENNVELSEPQGTAVAQWLRCYATNRKVPGSIPDGVIGIFQ